MRTSKVLTSVCVCAAEGGERKDEMRMEEGRRKGEREEGRITYMKEPIHTQTDDQVHYMQLSPPLPPTSTLCPPDIIHVMNVSKSSPFFTVLLLLCNTDTQRRPGNEAGLEIREARK